MYPKLLRDPGGGMGKEALKIIHLMNELPNRWVAGKNQGQKVAVTYNLPIRFCL